jgi:hypothetical protein
MLTKIAGSFGSFLGSVAPGLVLKIADLAIQNDPSVRQTVLDGFFTGLATSIKKEISTNQKINPSEIAVLIAITEVEFRRKSPKSLWYTWSDQDLVDFLNTKVGIHITMCLNITEVYMTSIYDVMNASLKGEIDLDQLSTSLLSNPDFLRNFQD